MGQPHDATKPLVKQGSWAAGSWWCAAGGWPSMSPRTTTEIFYVWSGHGCVTDLDGHKHFFGPGDTVVLPKDWTGRWDVLADIHKIWCVNDHPSLPPLQSNNGSVLRAVISHYCDTPEHIYAAGPQTVGSSVEGVGPTPVPPQRSTEWMHILEGSFYLTEPSGRAQKCGPGDTIVVPAGWTGHCDVLEPVKKLSVFID